MTYKVFLVAHGTTSLGLEVTDVGYTLVKDEAGFVIRNTFDTTQPLIEEVRNRIKRFGLSRDLERHVLGCVINALKTIYAGQAAGTIPIPGKGHMNYEQRNEAQRRIRELNNRQINQSLHNTQRRRADARKIPLPVASKEVGTKGAQVIPFPGGRTAREMAHHAPLGSESGGLSAPVKEGPAAAGAAPRNTANTGSVNSPTDGQGRDMAEHRDVPDYEA
jgi:hypothetical protein